MIFRPVTVHPHPRHDDILPLTSVNRNKKRTFIAPEGRTPRARLRTCLGAYWKRKQNFANMAVTMYAFLEAILLLVNAVAVLNEERFLAKSKSYCSTVKRLFYYITFVYKYCT